MSACAELSFLGGGFLAIRLPPPRFALRRASPKRSEGGKPDHTLFCEFCGFCVECRGRVAASVSRTCSLAFPFARLVALSMIGCQLSGFEKPA